MQIISPNDVAPMVDENYPPEAKGKIFHRRVLSALTGGPGSIDIDYNNYAGGLGGRLAYAYTKDEFCYQAAGRIVTESRGITDDVRPGTFMWRPAGSATDAIEFKEDSITICAFGPAREDEWSHRLAPEIVGEWDGNEETRRIPIYRHFSVVDPSSYPAAPDDPRIEYRKIFSRERDGSRFMDIARIAFDAGTEVSGIGDERDEIWWLEAGSAELLVGGQRMALCEKDFLFRRAGERIDQIRFPADAVVISYSAPTA
jgi:hypothetical protein